VVKGEASAIARLRFLFVFSLFIKRSFYISYQQFAKKNIFSPIDTTTASTQPSPPNLQTVFFLYNTIDRMLTLPPKGVGAPVGFHNALFATNPLPLKFHNSREVSELNHLKTGPLSTFTHRISPRRSTVPNRLRLYPFSSTPSA
jgi:hypothetical protein